VHDVSFSVVNSEGADAEIVILVQGELNQSIALSEVSFSMSPTESEKHLTYTVTMPASLTPGPHRAEIIALQLPSRSSASQTFVGATVGVVTQLVVDVPYPGKFLETAVYVTDNPENSAEKLFIVPVVSKGDLDIVRTRAIIEIYGALNEEIARIETGEVPLPSGERKELVGKWEARVPPGMYRAVVTVVYDEQVARAEQQFSVGTRRLTLDAIEVNDFALGGIAKFEMLIENTWSETLTGVYSQTQVFNAENEVMADFKSATYDIPPLSKSLVVSFWDTEGVREGTYDAALFLRHEEASERQDIQLDVSDDDITVIGLGYVISSEGTGGGDNSLIIVLVSGIVVLVLINVVWFLVLRKKLSRKR